MEPILAHRVFQAHKGWKSDKDDDSFWFEFWCDAGFMTGLDTPENMLSEGGIQVSEGDEFPAWAGIYSDSESLAVRMTDLIRQHASELRAQVGDFVLSQDHKQADGSWNTYIPVWTYIPGREEPEALVKCMLSYRDAFTKYLDQLTPRLADGLAAYRAYCQQVQPVLAEKVFNRADGWRAYRSEKQSGFGFYLWDKVGFLTGLQSRGGMISEGGTPNDDDKFPRYIGVYCNTKGLSDRLTGLVRSHEDDLRALVGDYILSQDHREDDGSWNYWVPVWAYLPSDEDCQAVVRRMTSYRDALTGYLDQITPRK